MLNGISHLISPELLDALHRMGHGDEIVLADAHFPGESCGRRLIRADGHSIDILLDAILPLFPLDTYVHSPLAMMAAVEGDCADPEVEARYRRSLSRAGVSESLNIEKIERFAFYERARQSFAVVMTGELAKYGNLILVKGCANPV
ncbi:MAG: L-fucose mutarotase [Candidatus Methylacidiphilales bacterium]